MNKIRVAINGFGRIGRHAFKIALERENLEIVAINDLTTPEELAYLLKYDTVYGRYEKEVKWDMESRGARSGHIIVDGEKYPIYAIPDPKKLPWKKHKVDVVIESTGRFVKDGAAKAHLKAGAKKVIVSAPVKGSGDIKTYVKGVNNNKYSGDKVISNASCTTNCISPVIRVIDDNFGVEKALMTTIHAYTSTQNIVDGPHKDPRRGRAAAQNIIPTTTGAAIATTKTIPKLKGKFDGIAMRVPVLNGSLADFSIVTKKKVTAQQINRAFRQAEKNPIYKGIIKTVQDPIVSSDIIGDPHSAIVDLSFTKVVGGNLVKVLAWYDNEYGYSQRLVDMVEVVSL